LTVTPANDPPEIVDLETEPLRYSIGSDPVNVSELLRVVDTDDNTIMLAEIGIVAEDFQIGGDMLLFTNTSEIRGVYDPEEGILSLIGVASLAAYQDAIRSVQYSFNTEVELGTESKRIYFKLNDGKNVSDIYERAVTMREHIELDIPNAFTPNSDQTNDTWVIVPAKKNDRLDQAVIRVYNKRGAVVFETKGFDQPWDGHYKGSILPADVYYYTIDLNMQTTSTTFSGSVSLIR
jgi:gliding motility-associated-like protein